MGTSLHYCSVFIIYFLYSLLRLAISSLNFLFFFCSAAWCQVRSNENLLNFLEAAFLTQANFATKYRFLE